MVGMQLGWVNFQLSLREVASIALWEGEKAIASKNLCKMERFQICLTSALSIENPLRQRAESHCLQDARTPPVRWWRLQGESLQAQHGQKNSRRFGSQTLLWWACRHYTGFLYYPSNKRFHILHITYSATACCWFVIRWYCTLLTWESYGNKQTSACQFLGEFQVKSQGCLDWQYKEYNLSGQRLQSLISLLRLAYLEQT